MRWTVRYKVGFILKGFTLKGILPDRTDWPEVRFSKSAGRMPAKGRSA